MIYKNENSFPMRIKAIEKAAGKIKSEYFGSLIENTIVLDLGLGTFQPSKDGLLRLRSGKILEVEEILTDDKETIVDLAIKIVQPAPNRFLNKRRNP